MTNGPTGALPQDFWTKIGAIATAIVNGLIEAGQLIYGGLIAIGNFFVALGEAIVEWGMKVIGTYQEALGEVQAALNKAGEILVNLLAWAWDFIVSLAQVAIDAAVNAMTDYVHSVEKSLNAFLDGLAVFDQIRTDKTVRDALLAGVAFALSFFGLQSLVRPVSDMLLVVQRLTQSLGSVLNPFHAAQALAGALGGGISSSVSGLFADVQRGISQGLGWLLNLDIGPGGVLDTLGVYSITPVDTSKYSSLKLETFISFA